MIEVTFWQAGASLVLVVIVVAVSTWRGLGLGRSVLWATIRATLQLLTVGVIFSVIFESTWAQAWAIGWVLAMIVVSAITVAKRSKAIPNLTLVALWAVSVTVTIVFGVVFGLGVLAAGPVTLVVIAGITIGNTMPAIVQVADTMHDRLANRPGQIEAMLALGFDASSATRSTTAEVLRQSLIPQIERTKVVGVIALPGAMTGLLLAGADPVDAVLVQLIVMILVLGAVAIASVIISLAIANRAITGDLRIAAWVRHGRP